MTREVRLANLILLEAEALKQCKSLVDSLALAEELTKDAIELAKLVNNKKENVCRK